MQLNLNCIKMILLPVRKSLPKLPASVTTCSNRQENYCFRPAQGMEARGGAEKTGANGVSEDFER